MYIKKLELLNFNGIEKFDSEFTGGIYFFTGDNEVGKSTVLNAIGTLLDGKRGEVLKNGEDKGFAKMVIGDDSKEYEVDLKFTKANPRGTLTIKSDDGMRSDNIGMLQKIFGYVDFDAVEFSRWSESAEGRRKQIAVVKSLLSDDVQNRINEIDTSVEKHKNARKDANAEVKTYSTIAKNAASGLQQEDIKKYAKKIDIEELMQLNSENAQLIEKAKTVRLALAQRTQQLADVPTHIEEITAKFDDGLKELEDRLKAFMADHDAKVKKLNDTFKAELERIESDKQEFESKKEKAEIWLNAYEENNPENTDVSQRLKEAQEHNEKHAKVSDYIAKKKDLKDAESKAKKHDDEITNLLSERETLISTSSLPIDGLSFTEDGLELNGVPFVPGKVSDSQIMEIAMKLTVAVNKNVKVFRIARGESLGADRLHEIIRFAKENGFQGFLENVVRGQQDLRVEEYQEK